MSDPSSILYVKFIIDHCVTYLLTLCLIMLSDEYTGNSGKHQNIEYVMSKDEGAKNCSQKMKKQNQHLVIFGS